MQSKFGLSLARIYKQRHATRNESRAKQRNPSSERQREQQQLPNGQPSCSNCATASGQETENVSETSSAKQRREERMKGFDIEFETKMRLEQARFKQRRLEL